ncbi:phosphatidylinositol-glycan biosynthesis class W protein-like isoform X2 [Dysidea avara]|uniref:phosphatidylinositol-glycan biosynthesis class W protein-like isoform X2 n=1 Tax=Dysidea avara TaxID=196820 RepID=UPI003328D0DF
MDYKQTKEAFVSNLNGTSFSEISAIISVIPVCLLFRHATVIFTCTLVGFNKWLVLACEFMSLIAPCVLNVTLLSDHVTLFALLIMLISFTLLLLSHFKATTQHLKSPVSSAKLSQWLNVIPYPARVPFLSVARCYTIILSCVAILAVDFNVFPRRFAKTETFGQGLMDTGVGLFVCFHGVVAREVRSRNVTKTSLRQYFQDLLQAIISSSPMIVLGCARLIATWGVRYQEHVTEYGVHWNFFFTLAIVKVLSTLLYPLLIIPSWTTGLVLITLHQSLLSYGGVTSYVINGPHGDDTRDNLISANREGIVSSLGYLSLYFLGMEIGRFVFKPRPSVMLSWLLVGIRLMLVTVVLWVCTLLSDHYIQQCSRRLANLTFVLWMVAIITSVLASLIIVDTVILLIEHTTNLQSHFDLYNCPNGDNKKTTPTSLLAAIDYNQLVFFLAGNLLTGLVNLSINTLAISNSLSVIIVLLYMLVLGTVSFALRHFNITLL